MADFGLNTFAAIASAVGTAVGAAGTLAAGSARNSAAEFQAEQLDRQAKEEVAAAQRDALQVDKQRDALLSRQRAVAAASGLGTLDDTVLDLAGDIAQEGAYQKQMVMYGGKERASGRRAQAAASRMEGKAAMTGAIFSAGGTIMDGIGSFASDWSKAKSKSPYAGRYSGSWAAANAGYA